MPKKHWFSSGRDFLASFEEPDLKGIEPLTHNYMAKEKEVLDLPVEAGRDVLYLRQGRVNLLRTDPTGRSLLLATLQPGDLFGELAVRVDTVGCTTAVAMADCLLTSIKDSAVHALYQKKPELAYEARRGFFIFQKKFQARIWDWLYLDHSAKVAKFLLERLKEKSSRHPRGQLLDFPGDPELIATLTGNSLTGVLLALGSFYKHRLLQLDGRRLVISDPVGLRYLSH